ncbi:MAG: pyruvate formate lyase-activating protein [Lachnospira sp.]|jgi:pyruvate formate lyase activating enzyme|uniref:Pyruvate formate-lyase-activating enzyme n=1 Tax=Lachnospira pectinoschiza TaxID=28052 RepID=A0A1G9WYN8_9FIRM|nr:pyruvate formate-lyase-activating protein [Lachnospira pectinoschiza]MCR5514853.1 pyruvate formate lyase-activating protein [Lachnospira sp.]SDM89381.1 pyruvate formate lyase activating enzyme [Lachnospira pectinoschiza]
MSEIIGRVNSLESFGSVDGPGVRYIVFLKGCHMRCKYCHNPETWSMEGGMEMTPSQIMEKAIRFKAYWKNGGGITVSGGEALCQIDFVIELFKLAKSKGINTCLDTSGNPFSMDPEYLKKFDELMSLTDTFLLDIKIIDDEKHKILTGWTNKNILELAKYLSDNNKDMWIRNVLVPGVTDDQEDLEGLRDFVASLKTVKRFEVLPYHTLGVVKYAELGIKYELEGVLPPTKEEIQRANDILETEKYQGYLGR